MAIAVRERDARAKRPTHREDHRLERRRRALAVVDIDTVWTTKDGTEDNWKGRVGKVYSRLASGAWKMTMQTGVFDYSGI